MRKREKNPAGEDVDSFSTALVRGLQILRAFGPADRSLGNLELMERTGLPKATLSRLTYTLAGLGYLNYNEVLGRYSLGSGVVALGYSALSANPLVHLSKPLMQKIADDTGAAVALGTRDHNEMIYLSNCRSESLVTLRLNIGSRVPLWRSAMGLAYLVGLNDDERNDLRARSRDGKFDDWVVVDRLLDRALVDYREFGYVRAFGTWHSYVNAIGVPFRPTDGSPTLAFTCGGISEIISEKDVREKIGPAMVNMVSRLAENLGSSLISPQAGDSL